MSDINLARLVFSMAADTAALQRDMANSKAMVGDAMDAIKSQVNTVKAAFGALAGALALNELVGMVTKVYDAGEKLHDLSIATGASVEALSALAAVGKTTGTSADTIATAMNTMAKNTAIASEESKGAGSALRALGISFSDFQQMSPDEKMMTVAQAMNQFEDGSGKAAVAMALMGRNGAQLLPYMRDLAETGALQARMTAEQAAMADNFNDNLVKLKGSGEAWKKELALGMLPALSDATNAMLDMTNSAGGLRGQVKELSQDGTIESWTRNAIYGFSYVIDVIGGVVNAVKLIGEAVGMAIADVVALAQGVGEAWERVKNRDFSGAVTAMGAAFDQVRANATAFGETLDKVSTDAQYTQGDRFREAMNFQEEYAAAFGRVDAAAKGAKPSLNDFTNAAEVNGKVAKDTKDEFDKLIESINVHIAAMDAQLIAGDKLTPMQKLQAETYEKLGSSLRVYTEQELLAIDAAFEEAKAREELVDSNKRLEEAIKAANKAQLDGLDAMIKSADQAELAVAKQREQNDMLGLSKQAVADLEAAKLRDGATTLELQAIKKLDRDGDEMAYNTLMRNAQALRDLADAKQAGGVKQAAIDAAAEFKKTSDSINNSLTDALLRGFESGKSFAVVFRDTVVNMFKTMVLRPVISAVMNPISMGIAGLMGTAGAANAATGAMSGGSGFLGSLGSLASGTGMGIMNGLSAWGAEGSVSAMFANPGLYTGAELLGAAMPWVGGAMLLASLFNKPGGGPKKEGGYSVAGLNAVADPAWAGIWSTSGGVSTMGESSNAKTMADSISLAYGQVAKALGLANTALNVGLSYAMDPEGNSQTQLQVVTANYNRGARLGGTENVARGEDALKAAVADETARVILAELQANIKGSVGEALNRIDATRAAAGDINDLITGLEGVYKTLQDAAKATYALEPMGGVFGRIAALGIDAKNSLIEMAGGVDALIAKSQRFVDLYYSDTERGAIAAKSILDATSGLGLSIGGISTLADYRALVEAQNVGTEEGRRAVNTLLDLAPTFANIAKLLGSDSGLTLASLAGQAANTPAADFLRQLNAANGGDTGKTTADLMQSWIDQSARASDTLNSLIERLINVTAAAAETNNALLANIAGSTATQASAAELAGAQ